MKKRMNRADVSERMNRLSGLSRKDNRKGYSLGEALIVVAIIVVLLAIAIPSVMAIKKNMRQTELDSKAEIIYEAVQNQLVKMRTSGNADIYQYKGDIPSGSGPVVTNGVFQFENIPYDADPLGNIAPGDICYITSEELSIAGSAASIIMEEGVVDEELRNNHWVIEYNPVSGSVYSVFYSENEVNCAGDSDDGYKGNLNKYDQTLRVKSERKDDGARVGYYTGNTIAKINNVKSLRPTLTITNEEKLTASIVCTVPVNFSENRPVFKVEIKDTQGNHYIKYYTYWDATVDFKQAIEAEMTKTQNSTHVSVEELDLNSMDRVGRRYTLDLVLDDLSSDATRFAYTYGAGSENNVKLASGTPLEITVTAMCPGNYTVTQNRTAKAITNSLFADANSVNASGNMNTAYGSDADNAAIVMYGRHLQNMDQSSGVDASVKYFTQGKDIFFNDQATAHDTADWYETYTTRYFNGFTTDGFANFKSIENHNLVSFNGQITQSEIKADGTSVNMTHSYRIANLHINATETSPNAGLFAVLGNGGSDQTISYVVLTGASIIGRANYAAGALAGLVNGDVTIEHCQSYLTSTDIAGKSNHDIWISDAMAVGGLIGNVNSGTVTINSSSASSVLGEYEYNTTTAIASNMTSDYVGGLIGIQQGGNLTISGSYADSYVVGKNAGGLVGYVGGGTLNITNTYVAGFITFADRGAGLVNGSANISNSYTTTFRQYLPATGIQELPYFATAVSGTMNNVYYESATSPASVGELPNTRMIATLEDDDAAQGMDKMDYLTQMLNKNGNATFTMSNTGSMAYNLMGQTLSAYSYPGIQGVIHYGDWKAEFQPGALVYYEVYKAADGTVSYGFYGANVDSSLRSDLEIVGDGYGFVYRKTGTQGEESSNNTALQGGGNLPVYLQIYIGDEEIAAGISEMYPDGYPITKDGNRNYYTTTDGYLIYPLDKTVVNTSAVENQYYTKVKVVNTLIGRVDYYYFNPLFGKTVVSVQNGLVAAPVLTSDSMISIRSARHLYNLSLYYDDYATVTESATYLQERNIPYDVYDWATYSLRTGSTKYQAPIAGTIIDGDELNPTTFKSTYNGQGFWITNVSFVSDTGLYTGMFGSNAGTIENVVLRAEYNEDLDTNCYVARTGDVTINQTLHQGVLAGRNEASGYIMNCAVAGYYLSGSDGTIHAYENSYVYAGGLVGSNAGNIENCSADTPAIRISSNYANVSVGGFVGHNLNVIRDSYALGQIQVIDAKGGTVTIAGFAGRNGGVIRDSYCVTALTAGGETTTAYGFAPAGGAVYEGYFLNGGTYSYVGHMYAYDTNKGAGKAIIYSNLKAEASEEQAVYSYNFNNTETSSDMYPFRAVVRNMRGELVHYGDWLDDEDMGSFGIFYWEHEEYGTNNGYHFTYLGSADNVAVGGTTLCTSHDDGGIITEYGYGFYEKNLGATEVTVSNALINGGTTFSISGNDYETILDSAVVNRAASEALNEQLYYTTEDGKQAPYYFFAFTTRTNAKTTGSDNGNYLRMNGTAANSTWTLKYTKAGTQRQETYEFSVSPFFADAMQLTKKNGQNYTGNIEVRGTDGQVTNYAKKPGLTENVYEVRSIAQLQYINWNNVGNNTNSVITNDNYKQFTYLMAAKNTGTADGKTMSKATDDSAKAQYHWRQTHDAKDISKELFTPIAGTYESSSSSSYNAVLYGWFGSEYDGQNYTIRNINISSYSFNVGLFGTTVGANIKNIILYSESGENYIERNTDTAGYTKTGAYAIGGLIGVAYDYDITTSTNTIENCAISGYIIRDKSTNKQGLGEANIGGLVGVANINLLKCTAVTEIQMAATHPYGAPQYGNYFRVGGITGATQGKVDQCYSGGSCVIDSVMKNENLTTATNGAGSGYHRYEIYVGGIAGSGFTSNYINFTNTTGSRDGAPSVSNSYTYFTFPTANSFATSSNGRRQINFTIVSLADRCRVDASGKSATISNCYYLSNIKTTNVVEIFNDGSNRDSMTVGSPVSLSYQQMADGTLLRRLGNGYAQVTLTEGNNISIDGKYSFPSSDASLIGKNYPFAAIIQQKDLTYGRYVYVHYGDWPLADAFWTKGRDSMDIFTDMQPDGYAVKTFTIDINGRRDLNNVTKDNFIINTDIAEIIDVGAVKNGKIEVKIRAVNVGTTIVEMKTDQQDVTFALEVTANMILSSDKEVIKMKTGETEIVPVTFTAKDAATQAIDFSLSDNGTWEVISEYEQIVSGSKGDKKNAWNIKREGLGETILEVRYTYDYHSDVNPNAVFTTSIYLDVIQPDTVGLSDNSKYSVAFMGESGVGESQSYKDSKPDNTDGDYYLYINSETINLSDMKITGIFVDDEEAVRDGATGLYTTRDAETGSLVGYYLSLDENISHDKLYEYKAGTIYHITEGNAKNPEKNVKLQFVVQDPSANEYTLTISLATVINRKLITVTYLDSDETGADVNVNEYKVQMLSGEYTLLRPEEVQAAAQANNQVFNLPTTGVEFTGWTMQGDTTGALIDAGYSYENLTESITLVPSWVNCYMVTYNLNEGTASDEFSIQSKYREGSSFQLPTGENLSRPGYAFGGWMWNTGVEGDEPVILTSVDNITQNMTFVAKWYREVKITLKDATQLEKQGYTGFSAWLWDDGSVGVTLYDKVLQDDVNFPDHKGYTLLGWYVMNKTAEGEYVPGPLVLDAEGKFVLNVPEYTDDNSLNLPEDVDEFTLYAYWGKDNTTKTVYAYTETLVQNEDYLITDSNVPGSTNVMTADNTKTSLTIKASTKPMYSAHGEVVSFIESDGSTAIADYNWKLLDKTISYNGENATYRNVFLNDSKVQYMHIGYDSNRNPILVIEGTFTAPATGWKYDTETHNLASANNGKKNVELGVNDTWLGSGFTIDADDNKISTGIYALDDKVNTANSGILSSYLYEKITVYEKSTFLPTYEIKLFAYDNQPSASADADITLEVVEYATKLDQKNQDTYNRFFDESIPDNLEGWYSVDADGNEVKVLDRDGKMPDHAVKEDVTAFAKWTVKLHYGSGASNIKTISFLGKESDLNHCDGYVTPTNNFEGWYAKETTPDGETEYVIVVNADGTMIDGKRLSDYTDLYMTASINLHYDPTDENLVEEIMLQADMTTLTTEHEKASNFDGWYTKEVNGSQTTFTKVIDAEATTIEIDLAAIDDLYAGWNVNLHTGVETVKTVTVFAATTSLNTAEGYPTASLGQNFDGWYNETDKVKVTDKETTKMSAANAFGLYTDLSAGWKVTLHYGKNATDVSKELIAYADTQSLSSLNGYPTESELGSNLSGWYKTRGNATSIVNTTNRQNGWSDSASVNGELYAGWNLKLYTKDKNVAATVLVFSDTTTIAIDNLVSSFQGWVDSNNTAVTNNSGVANTGINLADYTELYASWKVNLYYTLTNPSSVTVTCNTTNIAGLAGYPQALAGNFRGWYATLTSQIVDKNGNVNGSLWDNINLYAGFGINFHIFSGKVVEKVYLADASTSWNTLTADLATYTSRSSFGHWYTKNANGAYTQLNENGTGWMNQTDVYARWDITFYTSRTRRGYNNYNYVSFTITIYGDTANVSSMNRYSVPTYNNTEFSGWYTSETHNQLISKDGTIQDANTLTQNGAVYAGYESFNLEKVTSLTADGDYLIYVDRSNSFNDYFLVNNNGNIGENTIRTSNSKLDWSNSYANALWHYTDLGNGHFALSNGAGNEARYISLNAHYTGNDWNYALTLETDLTNGDLELWVNGNQRHIHRHIVEGNVDTYCNLARTNGAFTANRDGTDLYFYKRTSSGMTYADTMY